MPGTTFLPIAGPLGTALGMAVGAAVITVIAVNYHYMMVKYPGSGGTFTYAKKMFGYDHGFLSAWFMILAYVSIIWANMTAIALIARNMFGDLFQKGYLYSIAGYDIYLGEIALEIVVLAIFSVICMQSKRLAMILQTVFAVTLIAGLVISFVMAWSNSPNGINAMSPAFLPEGSIVSQIMGVVALAPWAFVGFESISNSAREFKFPVKRSMRIMVIAIIAGFLSYSLLAAVATMVQPEGYSNWTQYIADIGNLKGLEGIPVFCVIETAGGNMGVVLLGASLISAILTGVIGSITASSRLLMTLSKERILPAWFGKVSDRGVPKNAVLFLMLMSFVIPFLGRTAIGWVVDVITVGTTIAYGYTSASAYKKAKENNDRRIQITGIAGVIISVVIGLLLLIPDLVANNQLSAESYLLLTFWGILGIVYFRFVFAKDKERRIGQSTVVWIALLFLIFFSSLMWVRLSTNNRTETTVQEVSQRYVEELDKNGIEVDPRAEYEYLESKMSGSRNWSNGSSVLQMFLIMLSLGLVFSIYRTMSKREKELEAQKIKAEEGSKAKTMFLSNMSHDIRSPMNAIIGYANLAEDEDLSKEEILEYLAKIKVSSQHLLSLINDILEMSRIESGKMELDEEKSDLRGLLSGVRDLFATQMTEKKINYTVSCESLENSCVICDKNRLNRVLLNLISNAYKFTPEGGSVSVLLQQNGMSDDKGNYELRVKDSGIGMTEEFAEKVFEAFERERTSTVSGIQGTGLGMAITKSIVDLMGGTIEVVTAPGKGTEFVVRLALTVCEPEPEEESKAENAEENAPKLDFGKMRLLVVDDVEINREIAAKILRHLGFTVEAAVDGKDAVDKVSAVKAGYFDAVIMDIQMPVMDGYEATKTIRALPDKGLAQTPIIALSANAFSEDAQKAHEAGMNGHIAKPIDINNLVTTLTEVLSKK